MLIFGQLLTIQSFNCTYIINYTYIMQFTRATCLQLNRFYKENHDKARAKPSDLMFAATDESGQLCAVLRLLPYSHFLFLRSVFTLPDMRGQGIAGELIGFGRAFVGLGQVQQFVACLQSACFQHKTENRLKGERGKKTDLEVTFVFCRYKGQIGELEYDNGHQVNQ